MLDQVAAGRDNREIADELTLSVRTVERHLQTIYRKLDLTGSAQRTAAAALALGAGRLRACRRDPRLTRRAVTRRHPVGAPPRSLTSMAHTDLSI